MKLPVPSSINMAHAVRSAVLAAICSTTLVLSPPASRALPPLLDDVIVEATEASYPILKALEPAPFQGWTSLVSKLIFEIDSNKLGPAIDLLADVYNLVPDADIGNFNSIIKDSFAGLNMDSCETVPLPAASLGDGFMTVAKKNVDPAKLKSVSAKWQKSLDALPKTDTAICLPTVGSLDKLAVAQANLGRSFDYNAVKKFNEYTFSMLKGEVKLTDETFALLKGAQMQAEGASYEEKNSFQNALKKLEAASKKEKEKAALARARVDAAAKAAAKQSKS